MNSIYSRQQSKKPKKAHLFVEKNEDIIGNAFEFLENGANCGGDGVLDLPDGGFQRAGIILGVAVEIRHHHGGVDRQSPNES